MQSQAPGDVDQTSQKTGPKRRTHSCSHRIVRLLGFVQAYCHILRIYLLMALSVHKAVCLLFLLLIFVIILLTALQAMRFLMPLQTVPHFQKSGVVFDDSLLKACSEFCKEPGTMHRWSTYKDLLLVCSGAAMDKSIPTHWGCFVTCTCPCHCRRCGLALKDTVTSDDNPCRGAGRAGEDPQAGSFQCLFPWLQRGGRESVPKGGVEKNSYYRKIIIFLT